MKPKNGLLKIHRTFNKEWGYVFIDKDLWQERRNLLIKESDWNEPPGEPHISVFNKEEVRKIPLSFTHGYVNEVSFVLTGEIKVVQPKDWKNVSECIFEVVEFPEMEEIRRKLGFPSFMFDDHEFHLTLGVKWIKSYK